ncbi:hypothetical protein, partial [Selenomonas sp.]|uniref:hypothetical protein n=1 Tax=Selenomonas sp. TaxID=2053611 RepID=UPI002A762DBB
AKENLGEMSKTVQQILGEEAVQIDENGKINIQTIQTVAAEKKQASIDEIDQRIKQETIEKSQIESNIEATKISMSNAAERIRALKEEALAAQDTAKTYSILHAIITNSNMAAWQKEMEDADRWIDIANNYHQGSGISAKIDDALVDMAGGPEGLIERQMARKEKAANKMADIIQQAENDGANGTAIQLIEKYGSSIEAHAAAAENYQGTAAQQERLAAIKENLASDTMQLLDLKNGANNIVPEKRGEVDTNNYNPSRHTSHSSVPKDPKLVYEYDSPTAKAARNLELSFSGSGIDVQTLLALVMKANGLGGITKEYLDGLTDPFQTGANDPFTSAWLLRQKFFDQKNAGKSPMEALAALYPNVDMAALEDEVTKVKKGEKKTAYAGWDFDTRKPSTPFNDPNNSMAQTGYVHDYASGAYSDPHLREIADRTAALISEKAGIYANPDFLYGQMMAEGASGNETAAANHNYSGLGGGFGVDYGSDENYIQQYAQAYLDYPERLIAIQASTAADFVDVLENSGRSVWFTA